MMWPQRALLHGGDDRPAAQERGPRVDAHDEIEPLRRRVGQRPPPQRTGVVDEDVDAAEALEGAGGDGLDLRLVAHVARHGQRPAAGRLDLGGDLVDRAGELLRRGLAARGDDDGAARPRQAERDGPADAAARAGDDGDSILEGGHGSETLDAGARLGA